MSIRLPVDASQNVQAAFRDVEQELEALKATVTALSAGTDLTSVNERIDKIQPPPQLDSDEHVFVGSGPQHSVGLVPAPSNTADSEAVLLENGSWGYPDRGLVRSATILGAIGDTQYGSDVTNVLSNLVVAGDLVANDGNFRDINIQNRPFCRLTRVSNLSTNSGDITDITWTVVMANFGALWSSSSPTRITLNKSGLWIIGGALAFAASAVGTYRYGYITKNGAASYPAIGWTAPSATVLNMINVCTANYYLAGDYFTLGAQQDSGGALNVNYDGANDYSPNFWAICLS